MSNSTAPPDSSSGSPPTPGGDTSPPSPEASSPPAPPKSSNAPPPPEGPTPAPPQSPPPSSPPPSPPQSPPPSSPPPSPPQSPPPAENSPPPGSEIPKSSPPPKKNHSPPPPHTPSHPPSSSPPPSPSSSEGPPAADSPPPAPPQSSPPIGTPPSSHESTPPPSESLSPPPSQFTPPPVSEGATPSPPAQPLSPPPVSPPNGNPSPVTPSNTTTSNGTSPTSSTSTTPPSSSSSPHGPNPSAPAPSPSEKDPKGFIIGGTVAGLLIIAFVALFFVARRRKKSSAVFATQYMPPNNFSMKSDGHYLPNSGPAGAFYTQPQQSLHGIGNSYGSQRGNMYYQGTPDSNGMGGAKSWFSYEEVMEITNGFARQNILGEGGFGCVYKGWLPDGKVVAVKQLKKGSGQGEREFQAEVEIISRVHHRYLVSLVGYCIAESQRLLIYEYVPNQTLEHHLHGKGMPVLEWAKRMKIALGAARGLAYLHEDCHPKIIHRDIKSANILLDDAFEAQVADFGLAKLTDDTNTHVSTRVMGTFGYMAPEYASSGKLTDRSDVFSFGVVLLELVTGRKPVDQTQPLGDESLVEWARPHLVRALDTGDFSELVDSRLEKHYVESEMFRMIEAAAACVRHSAPKRPRMMQVARALDCESEASDLSNGVKYGQSTVYESGQYNQDITRFRRMAFGSGGSKEFDIYSGEYTSREITPGLTNSWKSGGTSSEFPSDESETQAMNARRGDGGRQFR